MAPAETGSIETPEGNWRRRFSSMVGSQAAGNLQAGRNHTGSTSQRSRATAPREVEAIDRRKPPVLEVQAANGGATRNPTIRGHGILIVGSGAKAKAVRTYLTSLPHAEYDFRGFAAMSRQIFRSRATDVEQVSSALEVIALARSRFVDEIIFTERPSLEFEQALLRDAAPHSINIRYIPDVCDTLRAPKAIRYIGDLPTIVLRQDAPRTVARSVKRCVDIAFSLAALVALSPLMALVAVAVRLDSRGPIFYTSARVGKKGRIIYCHKFRTMVPDAAALLASVAHLNDRDTVLFKIKKDPRLTRIGRFLRKYSVDELPQLWNVVRGDMSLVGPRPSIESEVAQYKTLHYRRLDVLPGLTGLWQVEARCDPSFENYIQLDSKYADEWSVWLDLKLIARTVRVVLMGTGV